MRWPGRRQDRERPDAPERPWPLEVEASSPPGGTQLPTLVLSVPDVFIMATMLCRLEVGGWAEIDTSAGKTFIDLTELTARCQTILDINADGGPILIRLA